MALPATAANLQTYTYDNLDHLIQYLNPNTRQDYSYDLAGNRTRRTTDGNVVDYDYAPNNNQLVATPTKSFSYDAIGRVINDGVIQFSYNHSGQLSQVVTSMGRTWYYYNGLGQRVGKWVSNTQDLAGDADHDGKITALDIRKIVVMTQGTAPIDLAADCNRDKAISLADVDCGVRKRGNIDQYPLTFTHYVYDPTGHLIGEYRQIGRPKQETVYLGDTPVLILMPGTTTPGVYTIDTDHLNTPRVIKTQAGAIVWRWDQSEPFGSTQPNSNPSGLGTFTYNLRFPGQYYDSETGLHYNMARYYHPDLGRYLQSDPIGLAGGVNTYTYVSNTPVNRIDPSGLLDIYGYQSRGGGLGWNTQYQLTFDPLSDNLQKAISLPAWLKYTLKVIPQIDTKPVGPLHPIKDFLQCGKLDAKLKKDYQDIYGDQQRLTRDEAQSFLNSMTEKYPEMDNFYPSPTDMLDQAESNSRNSWYYMLRPE
jgi:RHS repeat-associated protein